MNSVGTSLTQKMNSSYTLIASLCHHDVIFAVSAFKILSSDNSDIRIITDSQQRYDSIISLLASLGVS